MAEMTGTRPMHPASTYGDLEMNQKMMAANCDGLVQVVAPPPNTCCLPMRAVCTPL
jgi:hypothetical protein